MQFKALKFFLGGARSLKYPAGEKWGSECTPDPPATFGCANANMLAMLAFPIGA